MSIAQSSPPLTAAPSPPRRLTASASIGEALRDEILALRLLPGSAIQERDLTAQFRVSRTPVREALIRLAEEGLIEIRPQAGTFVARIPLGSIPEAVVVRQALEGTAAELAAAAVTPDGARALDAALRRQEAYAAIDDPGAFHLADDAFHELVAALSGHPGMWRVTRAAKLQIDRCRRLTMPVLGRMANVVREHTLVVDAIKAGDASAARAAMQRHLHAVLPDTAELARRHPEFFV